MLSNRLAFGAPSPLLSLPSLLKRVLAVSARLGMLGTLGLPLLAAADVPAQVPANRASSAPVYRHQQKVTVEDRVKRLSQNLTLTSEQQVKVRVILQQRQAQAERMRVGGSLSAIDRVRQIQAMDRQTVERIKALLTEEQRHKYEVKAAPHSEPNANSADAATDVK